MLPRTEIELTEACHRLNWKYQRGWSAAMAGLLVARRVGGRWLVEVTSVEQILAERKRATAEAVR